MWLTVSAKSGMLKDRDYDVTPYIIAHILRQIRNGSAKSARCTLEMGVGRRRVRGGLWGGGWVKPRL